MKQIINDFINSIDTKLYSRLRGSMGDAECRRYLKEHLQKQLTIHSVVVSDCLGVKVDKSKAKNKFEIRDTVFRKGSSLNNN